MESAPLMTISSGKVLQAKFEIFSSGADSILHLNGISAADDYLIGQSPASQIWPVCACLRIPPSSCGRPRELRINACRGLSAGNAQVFSCHFCSRCANGRDKTAELGGKSLRDN